MDRFKTYELNRLARHKRPGIRVADLIE